MPIDSLEKLSKRATLLLKESSMIKQHLLARGGTFVIGAMHARLAVGGCIRSRGAAAGGRIYHIR